MAWLLDQRPGSAVGNILLGLGGIGPLFAAIYLLFRIHHQKTRGDYWKRATDFRSIGPGWYAITLLTVPAVTAAAFGMYWLSGSESLPFDEFDHYWQQPWAICPFALFIFFFGPVPEELGWRGYALYSLQHKNSPLTASMMVGAAWAVWHLPLFFVQGTLQHELGFGSSYFWLYMLALLPQSIIITWIFNHNAYSTLTAILYHFSINFTGELTPTNMAVELFKVGLLLILAGVVSMQLSPSGHNGRRLALQ